MSGAAAHLFDALYRENEDPWGFRTRWYERRKRQITLASLPQERCDRAWEMGCSNGELAAALAERCDSLLATDGNARAAAAAAARLHRFPHARVTQQWHPREWPEGTFDLIVVSEIGYYVAPGEMPLVASNLEQSLAPAGVLLACHWRHPIAGCDWTGDQVHAFLREALGWPELVEHREEDFLLHAWCRDGCSVAAREALR